MNLVETLSVLELDAAEDDGGHWVTIEEEHVFLNKKGDVKKGPKGLVNKNVKNLPSRSKPKWHGKSMHQDKLDHSHNQLTQKGYTYRYSKTDNKGNTTHVYTRGDTSKAGKRAVANVVERKDGKHTRTEIKAGGPGSGRHPWGRQERVHGIPSKSFSDKVLNKDKTVSKKGKIVDKNRSAIAKSHAVRIALKEQALAENVIQQQVAKAVGGQVYGNDSEAVDVVIKDAKGRITHGIEVKGVIVQQGAARAAAGKLPQISMKREAVERKNAWSKQNKAPVHTVIVDVRNGTKNPIVYHANRVGNLTFGDDARGGAKSVIGGLKGLKSRITDK